MARAPGRYSTMKRKAFPGSRLKDRRPSAAARGYDKNWEKLRKMVIASQPFCAVPGCGRATVDVDHIVPLSQGGKNVRGNLQGFCHKHHSRKTALEDGGFGRRRKER